MAKTRVARLAFNRGRVSRFGLARADINRLAFSAETHTNWISRVLGSMSIRPGTEYLGSTYNDTQAVGIPFVFSTTDKAVIEVSGSGARIWQDDALLERVAVTTTITNGDFSGSLTGWTDDDELGANSAQNTGLTCLLLQGTGANRAIRTQQVTVASGDRNVEHALRIVIERGPVTLRVGSTSGGEEYLTERDLETGTHSLAFTPTGNFYVQFSTRLKRQVLVDSCNVESSGVVSITTPWAEADLPGIRYAQSGDVVFIACDGYQQRKIERQDTRSWSVVKYEPENGPFEIENTGPITLWPGALFGVTNVVASAPLFRSGHVGALFRVTSNGQSVQMSVSGANQFTNAIKVTGVTSTTDQRLFTISITGTWAGTVQLQRSSISEDGPWEDVSGESWIANATPSYTDGFDNQIIWYRIGIKTGQYTSGTAVLELNYIGGGIDGVFRIVSVTNSTTASVNILTELGAATPTDRWSEGSWSDHRGWPTAVAFNEGRLGWSGRDKIWLSVSDDFENFDDTTEGDSGPIARSIGSGPVDKINWLLPLQRLILGGEGAEFSVRSSSLDEPLTPTNFNIKEASTQGSADVAAAKIDQTGIFVQRGGIRVYQLAFATDGIDYTSTDLSALIPEIGSPGIVKLLVQRQPDTRLHCIRSDGTVAILIWDKVENVICWLDYETDGVVEDGVILPGDPGDAEDWVYYFVKRTINGSTKRFFEKWAFESECRPTAGVLTACKLADAHLVYSGSPTTVISAPHLASEEVVVWADGADIGTDSDGNQIYTLDSSGNATLQTAVSDYVVGLAYTAPWKSARLVELMANPDGSLADDQIITGLSLILADTHAKGVMYGRDTTEANMNDLPEIGQDGAPVDPDEIHTSYTTEKLAFPGDYSKDARLCLLAKAPRPCTVLAAIADVEHH